MKPAVKNAVESALVAAAVALTFLWFLISAATAAGAAGTEDDTLKLVFLSLGLAAACLAHLYFMWQAAMLDGRNHVSWALLLVLTFPFASIVLLVRLYFTSVSAAARQAQH
jgi:hypothetical protein